MQCIIVYIPYTDWRKNLLQTLRLQQYKEETAIVIHAERYKEAMIALKKYPPKRRIFYILHNYEYTAPELADIILSINAELDAEKIIIADKSGVKQLLPEDVQKKVIVLDIEVL